MSAEPRSSPVLKCQTCAEPIASDDDYLCDDQATIHIRCYTCSTCHTSLAGRFYYRYRDPRQGKDTHLLCDTCYFRLAPVCFQCLKIIDDISLIYGERIFHPTCFLCEHCQQAFKGALVFPYGNHVYCAKCYAKVQHEFRPGASVASTLRCAVCAKKFEPGDLITKHQKEVAAPVTDEKPMENSTKNIHYIHNSCFVCQLCHRNLSNAIYYSPNTHDEDEKHLAFQCQQCHRTSATICSICFKPPDEVMVIYNNRWYHDECFKCKYCHYKLKSLTRIITEPDGLSCERCLKINRDQQQQQHEH